MDEAAGKGARPAWNDGVGEVHVHPSSLVHPLEAQQFARPYLVYLEKVLPLVARVFLGGPSRLRRPGMAHLGKAHSAPSEPEPQCAACSWGACCLLLHRQTIRHAVTHAAIPVNPLLDGCLMRLRPVGVHRTGQTRWTCMLYSWPGSAVRVSFL